MTVAGLLLTGQVAAVYIGTVVGAGFASGQEIVQFFTRFGKCGFAGVLGATALFCWLGWKTMRIARVNRAGQYTAVMRLVCGPRLGYILNVLVTIFLVGGLSVMVAGVDAIGEEYLGWSHNVGAVVTLALAVLVVCRGLRGILWANMFIVPCMVGITLYISAATYGGDAAAYTWQPAEGINTMVLWPVAAFLYVSYNLTTAVPVLAPLAVALRDVRAVRRGAIGGGLGLGLLGGAIFYTTLSHLPLVLASEIPMLPIAQTVGPQTALLYAAVLWLEMFTTAIADLYGFAAAVSARWSVPLAPVVVFTAALGFGGSQWGFAALVQYLYPLFGLATSLFIVLLVAYRQP